MVMGSIDDTSSLVYALQIFLEENNDVRKMNAVPLCIFMIVISK